MKSKKKFKACVYRDSWSVYYSFKKWLLPRLKCLREYNFGYPADRDSLENWHHELDEKILWLEYITKIDSHESMKVDKYTDQFWNDDNILSHCSVIMNNKMTLAELREAVNKSQADTKYLKQMYVEDALHLLFGEWFGKNYGDLWW